MYAERSRANKTRTGKARQQQTRNKGASRVRSRQPGRTPFRGQSCCFQLELGRAPSGSRALRCWDREHEHSLAGEASQGGQPSEALFAASSRSPGELLRGAALCAAGMKHTGTPSQGRRCVLRKRLGPTLGERSTVCLCQRVLAHSLIPEAWAIPLRVCTVHLWR